MGVADVTSRDAVLAAIESFRDLGEEEFLTRYRFGPARDFVIVHDGDEFPSKAILGVAHGIQHPDLGALPSGEFNGGKQTTDRLRALGFTIRQRSAASKSRVFTVRAGENGEIEDFCLVEGWCGVGWDAMPELSGMGDEEVDRAMDAAYSDVARDTLGQWKYAIKEFKRIAVGDLILMPLKKRRGNVAVGEVVGPYERRADFHELARHVYKVRWLRDDVPRELIGDFRRWMDRPPTASEIPVDDASQRVREMLGSWKPIRVAPDTASSLRAVITDVLAQLRGEPATLGTIAELVTTQGPAALHALVGEEWPVNGGAGVGTPAVVPWFGLYPQGSQATAQSGFYLVYLFAADGSAAYLSLNQGTENVQGGLPPLKKRAHDLRQAAQLPDAGDPVDLRSAVQRPRKYEAGSAYARRYEADDLPTDESLAEDLDFLHEALQKAAQSGLSFDPEIEPVHLLFKWSAEIEPATVDIHREIADEKGSAWWCRYGTSDPAMSARRLSQLREQLDRSIPTYAFLYGGGHLVRSRLHQLEVDPGAVDEDRVAGYHDKQASNLFARVSDFEDLGPDWALTHLLPAKDADPASLPGALGNRQSPLYVYERAVTDVIEPTDELTVDWLVSESLWTRPDTEELLEALESRGQVILAGPPGTGKTWVASRIARYLTQDEPLRTRIVQFHPSYGYEEFVEGLRPVVNDGAVSFERVDGVILQLAAALEGSDANHVLIIDEINRANIPRTFGELLYLLEYRGQAIDLQYSQGFELPENLKIIATMNTADRSIRSIDVALRRRFEIFECPADADVLGRFYEKPGHHTTVGGLIAGFKALNEDLTANLDRHHTIGQSFFMDANYTRGKLERIWVRQIAP